MDIVFTNNKKMMIEIGEKIYKEKKDLYSGALLDIIVDSINQHRKNLSEKAFKDTLYLSIYNYWAYGVSCDEFFYYDFEGKSHSQKIKYMTYRLRMLYGDYLNDFRKKELLMNKYKTYCLFKDAYKRDVIICRSVDDFQGFLSFTEKHPFFVVKPTDMGGGRGVHKADVNGLTLSEKRIFFENLLSEGIDNKRRFLKGKETSVVLEELIEQDDRMGVFNQESINGVRINTYFKDGKIIVFEPWLKIGRGGNFLTSAVYGTMDAGINVATGVVDTYGFTEKGDCFEFHPDNGIRIEGFIIPRWEEAIELAKECAKKLPLFRYIAWDFALSKKGWCIMEANYNGDFMWQLYREKGAKKEFEKMIGWKLDKKFWWE